MNNINQVQAQMHSLLDLVKAVVEPPRFELGPSSGNDSVSPLLRDDERARIETTSSDMPKAAVLGACVGDDLTGVDYTITSVGPSIGDDAQNKISEGPEFGAREASQADRLGPCVGDDFSDRRLKKILSCVGTTNYGLPLYRFSYWGRPGTFEGVMAQDVLQIMPTAVRCNAGGFYSVNYAMLGITMRQIS